MAEEVRVALVDPEATCTGNDTESGADVAAYLTRHGALVSVDRPGLFRHDHHRRADDGGIGELQLDRLRREELLCRKPEFNRKATRGQGTGDARMERPLAIPNGEIRYHLRDRNGKTLKPVT